jgi:hypothetical protein
MTHAQLVPTGRLTRRRDWKGGPVDYVNASQLKLVSQGADVGQLCTTAWAIRYLHGLESRRVQRGPLLGKLLHRTARNFSIYGKPVCGNLSEEEASDLHTWGGEQALKHGGDPRDWCKSLCEEAVVRFMPGIPHLPLRDDPRVDPQVGLITKPLSVECEFRLWFDDVLLGGTTDLRIGYTYGAHVWDHKTTRGKQVPGKGFDPWFYVPTVEDLSWDPQFLMYLLKASAEAPNAHYITGTWIYYLTDPESEPTAITRSVTLDRFEIQSRFRKRWMPWARFIASWVQWYRENGPPPLAAFARASQPSAPFAPCQAYSKCDNGNNFGGPCNVFTADPQRLAFSIAEAEEI